MKILIVEDEIRIREGLVNLIQKINKDYVICGQAGSGEEGLELFEQQQPDLIITDICMADMSGLDMLEELKEKGMGFRTILVTAYSEFEYARSAIRLDAMDYLLKPISIKELDKALKKAEESLAAKPDAVAGLPADMRSLAHVFTSLMVQDLEMSDQLQKFLFTAYQLNASGEFIMIPVYLGSYYQEFHERLQKELAEIAKQAEMLHYELIGIEKYKMLAFIIYNNEDPDQCKRWFQNRILMKFSRENKYHISVGWIIADGLKKLKNSLDMIYDYLHWSIVLGDNVMIAYPQITQVQTTDIRYPMELEEKIKEHLCLQQSNHARSCIFKFQEYYQSGKMIDPQVIKEHYMRFLLGILKVGKDLDFASFRSFKQQELAGRIAEAITASELKNVLNYISELIMEEERFRGSEKIQRIKSLAHEYYQDGITLDEIARMLNMTPEYLGTLFRTEEGINFNQYMKCYRIQKAKQILLGTNLKIYEVAEKVGYSNAKYFSKVFKEIAGCLPAEYRSKNK